MLQIAIRVPRVFLGFYPHRGPLNTARSRVSYTLPDLLTAKGLDTALVICPTRPRFAEGRNDTPQCHEAIAGNMLGNFHRQLNTVWAR